MKEKKKCYISAKELKKARYRKMISAKYNLIFSDDLSECDLLVAPLEIDKLDNKQKLDIEKCIDLGIPFRVISEASFEKDDDFLKLSDHVHRLERDNEEELGL